MIYTLAPAEQMDACVQLPASKSISNRVLILHALAKGQIAPQNLSDCDDTEVMVKALAGDGGDVVNIHAAGTAMRFLTAYLSVTPGTRLLTGTQRMRQRPIRVLVDALRSLGAQIEYVGNAGFPPLRITGAPLHGHEVSLAGNVSSQYISALLMIGPTLPQGLLLHLTGQIVSRPYIDLTLSLMAEFGVQARWTSPCDIAVCPGKYRDIPFVVESDWSAASYWYEIVSLAGAEGKRARAELKGLLPHSCQGDSRGAKVFSRLGVYTEYTPQGVRLTAGQGVALQPGEVLEEDLVDIPDLAQTLAVTCCCLGVPFRFTGLQSLKIKETDRMAALVSELRKLGYVLHTEGEDTLAWDGKRCELEPCPVVETYEDHRMAMAFAPACLVVPSVRIAEPHVVSKSYPAFWDDLAAAGFRISPE